MTLSSTRMTMYQLEHGYKLERHHDERFSTHPIDCYNNQIVFAETSIEDMFAMQKSLDDGKGVCSSWRKTKDNKIFTITANSHVIKVHTVVLLLFRVYNYTNDDWVPGPHLYWGYINTGLGCIGTLIGHYMYLAIKVKCKSDEYW